MKIKEMSINYIAKVCHEANRAFCETIDDYSQPTWVNAPDWQKQSAREGVQYRLDNPDTTPKQMHQNWMDAKRKDGWKFGATKNPDTKTHPCMCKYENLPPNQRFKDSLFSSIVDQFREFFCE